MALFVVIPQVDDLHKEVLVLKDRVREQRAVNESRASKQQENMNGLRANLLQLTDDADHEDGRIRTVHAELTSLLGSVETLFLSVHCDVSPMYKILGKRYSTDILTLSIYIYIYIYYTRLGIVVARCLVCQGATE